jgi:SAM-dependent methyltransferase
MAVSSYGNGTESSGRVKINKDLDNDIQGKDIIIIEDILDSGKTLYYIRDILSARKPTSIKICTLFDKPERREADIKADYVGSLVPNEFIVGYGLDYSEVAVEKSTKLNQAAIDEGRCEIIQGSVSELPFEDNTFDIITGFETVYFWPDFINDSKEVRRVLKDDGIMFICNEAIPNEGDERQRELIDLLEMEIYSEDEFDEYLREAGFSDIICFSKDGQDSLDKELVTGWLCVIARK